MTSNIAELVKLKGPISFYEFMNAALYHPAFGYYSTGKCRIGRDGDFYTSASVNLFAWTIAEGFINRARATGLWTFVELGGGDGSFASEFLSYLERVYPEHSGQVRYVLVDPSPDRGAKLEKGSWSSQVDIHTSIEELDSIKKGCIFGNEVLDALPARRFTKTERGWEEIFVEYRDGSLVEVLTEPQDEADIEIVSEWFRGVPCGTTVEYQPDLAPFIRSIAEKHREGIIVLLDYFSTTAKLGQRAGGTLRCFAGHRLIHDPYVRAGECDMTVTVNKNHLLTALEEAGYTGKTCMPQWRFLMEWGIESAFYKIMSTLTREQQIHLKMAFNTLVSAGHMGEAFSAVAANKNLEPGP